ncbi:hypothetical protein ACLOJK_010166 [Asimina triloba]
MEGKTNGLRMPLGPLAFCWGVSKLKSRLLVHLLQPYFRKYVRLFPCMLIMPLGGMVVIERSSVDGVSRSQSLVWCISSSISAFEGMCLHCSKINHAMP